MDRSTRKADSSRFWYQIGRGIYSKSFRRKTDNSRRDAAAIPTPLKDHRMESTKPSSNLPPTKRYSIPTVNIHAQIYISHTLKTPPLSPSQSLQFPRLTTSRYTLPRRTKQDERIEDVSSVVVWCSSVAQDARPYPHALRRSHLVIQPCLETIA